MTEPLGDLGERQSDPPYVHEFALSHFPSLPWPPETDAPETEVAEASAAEDAPAPQASESE